MKQRSFPKTGRATNRLTRLRFGKKVDFVSDDLQILATRRCDSPPNTDAAFPVNRISSIRCMRVFDRVASLTAFRPRKRRPRFRLIFLAAETAPSRVHHFNQIHRQTPSRAKRSAEPPSGPCVEE
jgi:hypothetical protein